MAAALDPATRRLLVRATVDNQQGLLKPEMFANVTIFTDDGELAVAVPREAIIYDGDFARVWVVHQGQARTAPREAGASTGKMMQVLEGLGVQGESDHQRRRFYWGARPAADRRSLRV